MTDVPDPIAAALAHVERAQDATAAAREALRGIARAGQTGDDRDVWAADCRDAADVLDDRASAYERAAASYGTEARAAAVMLRAEAATREGPTWAAVQYARTVLRRTT